MRIGVIPLVSDLRVAKSAREAAKPLMCEIRGALPAREADIKNLTPDDIPVVFIKSGGVEQKFREIAPILSAGGRPITIIAENGHNALAAALEILVWCRRSGLKNVRLLHGPRERICALLKQRADDLEIMLSIQKSRIGVVGAPSDWLIGSAVDYDGVRGRWGASIIDIDIQWLIDYVKNLTPNDVAEILPSFPPARFMEEVGPKEIGDSLKIYLGLRRLIADYELNAVTVRCFDLLQSLRSTACLALSRLNDEGIPSGCEGDVPGVFTMLVNRLIAGEPSFMANPWRIEENRVFLCHCAAPLSMVRSFSFKSHFESGRGLAVAGDFPRGAVTLSRIGGISLEEHYAGEGGLLANTQEPEACRSQVIVELEEGTKYFFENPLGNHHILTYGRHRERICAIMELANNR